jgi:hypothetical protein
MKKHVLFLLFTAVFIYNLSAQEFQFSLGTDFGIGRFKVNNDFVDSGILWNEESDTFFSGPGLSFMVRWFTDTSSAVSTGFVFRDRIMMITNAEITGTLSSGGFRQRINETYSIVDDDSLIMSIMDFGIGPSFRIKLSQRWSLYTDYGLNFTIMEFEDIDEGDTLNYWGAGIFSTIAMQVNLRRTLFLEFGLHSSINVLSSQKGEIYYNHRLSSKYEDTGRWDLPMITMYLHIGWRFDFVILRN